MKVIGVNFFETKCSLAFAARTHEIRERQNFRAFGHRKLHT